MNLESVFGSINEFFNPRTGPNFEERKALYQRNEKSFADELPWLCYDKDTKTFVLEDGISRGAVLTLTPLATEGRSVETLKRYRSVIEELLSNTFEERDVKSGQWVISQYTYDDPRLYLKVKEIEDYVPEHLKETPLTKEYLRVWDHHLRGISKENGIFEDEEVTKARWGGRLQRTKLVIYRRVSQSDINNIDFDATEEINDLIDVITTSLEDAEIKYSRDDDAEFFSWMFRWFNPAPKFDGDKEDFYEIMTDGKSFDSSEVIGEDLRDTLISTPPKSDTANNCWFFDEQPTKFIRVLSMNPPRIGQVTGEVIQHGAGKFAAKCMLDNMPRGSIIALTTVIQPQSDFETQVIKLSKNSNGDTGAAAQTKKSLNDAKSHMGDKKVVSWSMGVYIKAETTKELRKSTNKTITVLAQNGFRALADDLDGLALNAFIQNLPMTYDPSMDTSRNYLGWAYAQHIANISFIYGRDEGTGFPMYLGFNRGGGLICRDPFNKKDRKKNAFQCILGPPGSGKSAQSISLLLSIMAVNKPRLFIIDVGNSFGLSVDYMEKFGLTVNRVKLVNGKNCPSLAPFADLLKVLNENEKNETETENDDDETRDVLGEYEMLCLQMVTGGEQAEYESYTRADRQLIKKAIHRAAVNVKRKNKFPITEDIIDALRELSIEKNDDVTEDQKEKLKKMAMSMEAFTNDIFMSRLFNTEGETWPDVDVTLVDLGQLVQSNYKDKLAIAYISLMQHVNNIGEKHQYSGRETVILTDEAHKITTNPFLAKFMIDMVKMFRKIGIWPILCTQNVTDFQGDSAKLLSMIEWYLCLVPPPAEADGVRQIRSLSDEQYQMLLSTTKQDRCYTEGVLFNDAKESLVRFVPPSLYLALAMTDTQEKSERASLMKEYGESELCSAYRVAQKMDKARGLTKALEIPESIK